MAHDHHHHDAPDWNASQVSGGDPPRVERVASTYMTDPEAEQFCFTFADGLDAGIGYTRILEILSRQGIDKKTVRRLQEALLDRGDMLGEALARYGILDPAARKLILVAEEQGVLPETFMHMSKIYGKRHRRKREFIKAMIEPVILLTLGIIVFGKLMSVNLIEMTMGRDTWDELFGVLTTAAIQAGMFGLVAFTVFFSWLNLPVDFAPRGLFNRIWMRVPVLSKPRRLFSVALFCRFFKQSLSSGMPVHTGLELAAEASDHPQILSTIGRARDRIADGGSLTDALYAVRALPDDVLENIDIGEESGRLDERLSFLAERYEDRASEAFYDHMAVYIAICRYGIVIFVIIMAFYSVLTMAS